MTSDRDLLKIGEFARFSDTSVRTLRYYEELGLLRSACRGRGGVRYFDRAQLDRIASIRRLQRLGLSLEWMARALFDRNGPVVGEDLLASLRAALRHQIVLTRLRIEGLEDDLQDLEQSYEKLTGPCADCEVPFSRENCDPCPGDEEPLPAVVRALLCGAAAGLLFGQCARCGARGRLKLLERDTVDSQCAAGARGPLPAPGPDR